MQDPRDLATYTVGAVTTGVGGLTAHLAELQMAVGILAGLTGVGLSAATFYWRRLEHKHRMEDRRREEREDNDETEQ